MIPCYNEEKTLARVIQTIPKKIAEIKEVRVLVVDDGSTDNSDKTARQNKASVISHHRNQGLGDAFRTGINEAVRLGADIIVNIDADGQFDSGEIPKIIKPIQDHRAQMVTATRFSIRGNYPENMPRLKKIGNTGFVKLMNFLTRGNFTDTQCGFRAYSREAAMRINTFGRFTYTQEVFIDLLNKGVQIVEIPTRVKYFKERRAKISHSLLVYGVNALMIILRTFRDFRPLVFFGLPGLTVFGLGLLLLTTSSIYWLISHQTSPVRMIVFTGGFLLVLGFLLIILALIADMLKRIRQNQEEIMYRLKIDHS